MLILQGLTITTLEGFLLKSYQNILPNPVRFFIAPILLVDLGIRGSGLPHATSTEVKATAPSTGIRESLVVYLRTYFACSSLHPTWLQVGRTYDAGSNFRLAQSLEAGTDNFKGDAACLFEPAHRLARQRYRKRSSCTWCIPSH